MLCLPSRSFWALWRSCGVRGPVSDPFCSQGVPRWGTCGRRNTPTSRTMQSTATHARQPCSLHVKASCSLHYTAMHARQQCTDACVAHALTCASRMHASPVIAQKAQNQIKQKHSHPQGTDTLATLVEGVRFILCSNPSYLETWAADKPRTHPGARGRKDFRELLELREENTQDAYRRWMGVVALCDAPKAHCIDHFCVLLVTFVVLVCHVHHM